MTAEIVPIDEHDHIWLQPWCQRCRDRGDARCWASSKFEPCEDCGRMAVRFDLSPDQPAPERSVEEDEEG
jgi:hypothetical protein